MVTKTKATIELYDGRQAGKRGVVWHLGAVLYHADSGQPETFQPKLRKLLDQAQADLQRAGLKYWFNSLRIAAMLVKLSAEGKHGIPALYPCLKMVKTCGYLYRVYLGPDQSVALTCYTVRHDAHGLLEALASVARRQEANPKRMQ